MGEGTFSADGTNRVSTNGTVTFPMQDGVSYNHWESYFEKGEYDMECGSGQWY